MPYSPYPIYKKSDLGKTSSIQNNLLIKYIPNYKVTKYFTLNELNFYCSIIYYKIQNLPIVVLIKTLNSSFRTYILILSALEHY